MTANSAEQSPAGVMLKQVGVIKNSIWNGMGVATNMMAGFVIAPYLVRHLGENGYGLWILISSLSGYFNLLDLGVRGSVGRNMAFYRAKCDQQSVNEILSTALAILGGVAVVAILATVGITIVFCRWFQVPPEEEPSVRLALLLVGINLALMLSLNVFDAVLWAYNRFDILNAIDIPTRITGMLVTFWVVGSGYGLVGLALVTLLMTGVAGGTKAIISLRLERQFRISFASVTKRAAHCLFGYGISYFVVSTGRSFTPQVGPTIIGSLLAVPMVTPYSIAMRLVGYGSAFLVATTQVLTPISTALHAEEQVEKQQRLFIVGGKLCLLVALFFLIGFILLGKPFIGLWIGRGLEASSYTLLVILMLGELIPMSQWVTYSTILGMGRPGRLAFLSLVEIILVIVGACLMATAYGVVGVAIVVAIAGALCRGVGQLLYGCRLAKVSLYQYFARAFLPALAVMIGPAVSLWLLVIWRTPDTWGLLLGYSFAFAVLFLLPAGWLMMRERRVNTAVEEAVGKRTCRLPSARGATPMPADSGQSTTANVVAVVG